MYQAVIGLGFGDEGKGVVTDYLCSQYPKSTAVMRFSGGHQCAHTVHFKNTSHIFSNFGSGTLRGCPTYWSRFCTFEPVGFCREYDILVNKGATPQIYIHGQCPVTTPYDIKSNWLSPERNHGTTGTGFWKTIERNENGVGVPFCSICLSPKKELESKMDKIANYYKYNFLTPKGLDEFYASIERIKKMLENKVIFLGFDEMFYALNLKRENIVFEGNQGLLLDKDIGFFPHVTPSKTNLNNIIEMEYKLNEVFLVSRAYQTRHGEGPITNEDMPLNIKEVQEEATKENKFQGKLRKTVLDLDLLKYAVDTGIEEVCRTHHIIKNLVVTCIDQVARKEKFKLTHNRELLEFDKVLDFANYIGKVLKIDGNIYGNNSPYSKTIKLICEYK